jgi:hypothetical protein
MKPYGYAVVMADGTFVGIWPTQELADYVCSKQLSAHKDSVVPVYNKAQLEELRDLAMKAVALVHKMIASLKRADAAVQQVRSELARRKECS